MPEETVVEEKVETPSHEPVPTVPVEEPTPVQPKEKEGEQATPPAEESLLDEIEKLEDGTFRLVAGDSTYYGKTEKEVLKNLYKGKLEGDDVIRKSKAEKSVQLPDQYKPKGKEEVEEPVMEMPDEGDLYEKHLRSEIKKSGIDPKLVAMFDQRGKPIEEKWDAYQDEHGLKDRHIIRMQDEIIGAFNRANEQTDRELSIASVAVTNNRILDLATKQVREMIADSGIDAEKFDYKAAIEAAMAKKDKAGRIPVGAIEAESGKQITKILRNQSPVRKDVDAEAERARLAKSRIKTPSGGGKVEATIPKDIPSYDQLAREEKGRIAAKAGREI